MNYALHKRFSEIERKLAELSQLLYCVNQNILHCADVIDTNFGPIDDHPEPDIDDGWEPACDSEEMP